MLIIKNYEDAKSSIDRIKIKNAWLKVDQVDVYYFEELCEIIEWLIDRLSHVESITNDFYKAEDETSPPNS